MRENALLVPNLIKPGFMNQVSKWKTEVKRKTKIKSVSNQLKYTIRIESTNESIKKIQDECKTNWNSEKWRQYRSGWVSTR
jgi:hypothetical protein